MEETRKCHVCGEEKPISRFASKSICTACYHRERRLRDKKEKSIPEEEEEFRIKIVPNSMGETFVVMPIEKYEELVRRAKRNVKLRFINKENEEDEKKKEEIIKQVDVVQSLQTNVLIGELAIRGYKVEKIKKK